MYDIGFKFGKMTVIGVDNDRKNDDIKHGKKGRMYYICRCECGKTTTVSSSNIKRSVRTESNQSCGLCYTFEDWCKDNNRQDYLDLWDYKLNDKKPSEIGSNSIKSFYFKCERGIHDSYKKRISIYTSKNNKNNIRCKKCTSFGQYLIDTFGDNGVNEYWGDKNNKTPFDVSKRSLDKVYIKCQRDNTHQEFYVSPNNFVRGDRCNLCSNNMVVKGINDIATTHPYIVKYFCNIKDAYNNTYGSSNVVKVKCQDCGNVFDMQISRLTSEAFQCCKCGDGISYPNKFMFNVLKQLCVDFKTEYSPDWIKPKRYDFYIPSKNLIIEMDGAFHYTDDNVKLNDIYKDTMANINGMSIIRINSKKSSLEFLKCNINEAIGLIFDLSNIDWIECHVNSLKSKVKEAYDLRVCGFTISHIAKKINVSNSSVISYINQYNEIAKFDELFAK